MYNETGFQAVSKPTTDRIGSFKVNEQSLEQVRGAMRIAKQMRREGDGEAEDAARAMVLLFGACMYDEDWFDVVVTDEEDRNNQTVAYMDGVAELRELFPLYSGAHLCRYRYAA
jgi:hypothetical protein